MERKGRLDFLDGLRGLAALNVVLNHFVCAYYPQMFFASEAKSMGGFLSLFCYTPLGVLVNGSVAVQFFFVLTGFLVARRVISSPGLRAASIRQSCINRYVRLLPTIFGATMLMHIFMLLGLPHHLQIIGKAYNAQWLKTYCNFDTSLRYALSNAFVSTFVSGNDYIRVFWTIKYELFGYIFSMILVFLMQGARYRRLVYALLGLLLARSSDANWCAFLMGIFVADLVYSEDATLIPGRCYKWLSSPAAQVALGLVGIYCACCTMESTGIYAILRKIPMIRVMDKACIRAAGVSLILFVLLNQPKLQRPLEKKPLLFLGKLSYSIYAVHMPLMLTVEAWVFDWLFDKVSYHTAALTAFGVCLVCIVAVGYLMWYVMEYKAGSWLKAACEKLYCKVG